jgi:hypothetical protein
MCARAPKPRSSFFRPSLIDFYAGKIVPMPAQNHTSVRLGKSWEQAILVQTTILSIKKGCTCLGAQAINEATGFGIGRHGG